MAYIYMSGVEMSRVELSGVEMSGVELSGVELSGVEISGLKCPIPIANIYQQFCSDTWLYLRLPPNPLLVSA